METSPAPPVMSSNEAGPSTQIITSPKTTQIKAGGRPRTASAISGTSDSKPSRSTRTNGSLTSLDQTNATGASTSQSAQAGSGHVRRSSARSAMSAISAGPSAAAHSANGMERSGHRRKSSASVSASALGVHANSPSATDTVDPEVAPLGKLVEKPEMEASNFSTPLTSPDNSPRRNPTASAALPLATSPTLSSTVTPRKGKGRLVEAVSPSQSTSQLKVRVPSARKQPEKRVLPARIRRAAGGGQEGIRDLEEMIVDWLERYGEPSDTPPDSLVLHLSTLPFALLDPPPTSTSASIPEPLSLVTTTPTRTAMPVLRAAQAVIDDTARIEVPTWKYVKAKDDDEEEARDEVMAMRARVRAGLASPVKRLRHGGPSTEAVAEDTSDAYYVALHKKYEVFERRQRIREKEKLHFERYKMRSRIDLLRGMSGTAWSAVLGVVLSRHTSTTNQPSTDTASSPSGSGPADGAKRTKDLWAKGRVKIAREGADWLRDTLVKEGEEVMKRYDQLLPPDNKNRQRATDSRTPTPMISPSPTPEPTLVLPHRVAALRGPTTSIPKRSAHSPGTQVSANIPRARSAPNLNLEARQPLNTSESFKSALKRKRTKNQDRQTSMHSGGSSEAESDDKRVVIRIRGRPAKSAKNGSGNGDEEGEETREAGEEPSARVRKSRRTTVVHNYNIPDEEAGGFGDEEEYGGDSDADDVQMPDSSQEEYRPPVTTKPASRRITGKQVGSKLEGQQQSILKYASPKPLRSRRSLGNSLAHGAGTTPSYEQGRPPKLGNLEDAAYDPLGRTVIEISPDEAREMREVEAVVL